MGWLDIIIGLLLLLNIISGYKNGFFEEVGGFVGLILGLFVAIALDEKMAHFLTRAFSSDPPWANILGFLIPFIFVILVFSIVAKLFSHFFNILSLGWLNGIAGATFSFFKGVFILSILLNIYEIADKDRSLIGSQRIEQSRYYKRILKVAPDLFPSFPDFSFGDKSSDTEESEPNNLIV